MRITVPMFAIKHQKIGGVESATYNLVRGLSLQVALQLVAGVQTALSPEFLAWQSSKANITLRRFSAPKPLSRSRFFEEQYFSALEGGSSDPVIYPNYFLPMKLHSTGERSVIIHDLQHKVFPQHFSRLRRYWLDFNYLHSLREASHVFLISNWEKHQVARFFGDKSADKCEVIFNAIDWSRFDIGEISPHIDELSSRSPYILSVSHQFPHKNVATLLKAFAGIADRIDEELFLVGTTSQTVRILHQQLSPAIRDRVHLLGFVSDADLGLLYRRARLFVLPSLYEGFGMPAVEAIGLGVPTIVSDAASLPEVTMGQARLVPWQADAAVWGEVIESELRSNVSTMDPSVVREHFSDRAVALRVLKKLGHIPVPQGSR